MSKSKNILIGLAVLVLIGVGVLYGIGYLPVHGGPEISAKPPVELVAAAAPKPAPALSFTDARGARHALADYKGHYVLLNLWATWCGPCVAELPALAKLKATVPGLTVLAVDVGKDTPATADAFLKSHQAGDLGTYVDTDRAFISGLRAYGMPTTVLIDPKGNMIARAEGAAEWASPETIAYFRQLTAAP